MDMAGPASLVSSEGPESVGTHGEQDNTRQTQDAAPSHQLLLGNLHHLRDGMFKRVEVRKRLDSWTLLENGASAHHRPELKLRAKHTKVAKAT